MVGIVRLGLGCLRRQIPTGYFIRNWDGFTMEMIIRMEHGYGSRALAGPGREETSGPTYGLAVNPIGYTT